MQNHANPQEIRPFWAKDRAETLRARIEKINKLNDPTTNADEILRWGKVFLFALLGYSALLGFFCYYKNFSKSFPQEVAIVLSIILPCAIEFGKNYCSTWAIRQPFFHGFPSIFASKAKTFIFAGLALIGVATFVMSIRNSTVGSQQLSLMFSHERNASVFTPDTRVIDEQIAATQSSINDNRNIKWKGTVTYQAQKSIQSQTKALTTLQSQRQEAIQQQRADWEKDQSYKTEQAGGVAALVLASGGWVELLQFLFLFLRVACEKLLDNRLPRTEDVAAAFNYQRAGSLQQRPETHYPTVENSRLIYFNRVEDTGQVLPTTENTVSHRDTPVSQHADMPAVNTVDHVLKLAEKELRGHHANFNVRGRKDSTVSANINRILDETQNNLVQYQLAGMQPTRDQAIRFYTYITGDLFPSLNTRGWPYQGDVVFAKLMFGMIPEKAPA